MVANGHSSHDVLYVYSYFEDPSSEVQARRSEVAKAVVELKAALDEAKERQDQVTDGNVSNLLARAYIAQGRVDAAMDAAEAALTVSEGLQDKTLEAKVHLTVSRIRLKQNDFDSAVQAVREAIAIYQETGNTRQEAAAFYALAGVCMEHGNLNEGHQAADKAQGLWQCEGDKKEETKSMLRLAEIVAMKGQMEEAIDIAEEAMVAARDAKNKDGEAECLRVLSMFHREMGDLDVALDAARKERLVREKAKDKRGAAQALHSIATIHLSRDEAKEAARAAEAAKNIYKKEKDVFGQVESLAMVAQAHMLLVSKMEEQDEKEGPVKENRLNAAATRAYQATEEAMEAIKDSKDDAAIGTANLSRGEVCTLFGETRESTAALRRAVESFRRIGDKPSLAEALLMSARGYQELKTPGLAEKAAEEALEIFQTVEDEEGVASAKELLEEIGPSGMAIGGGGGSYEEIGEAAAGAAVVPAAGAASAAGAVQKNKPDPVQVKEQIRKEVEQILGSDDNVEDDTPLMDTGLDSLSSVQFRNDLTRDFNVKLPASLMFDYPTIGALTEKIIQALEEADE